MPEPPPTVSVANPLKAPQTSLRMDRKASVDARQAQLEASQHRVRGCERMSDAKVMTIATIVVATAITVLVYSIAASNGDGIMPPLDQGALYHGHTGTGD